jgi:hypothetical protein
VQRDRGRSLRGVGTAVAVGQEVDKDSWFDRWRQGGQKELKVQSAKRKTVESLRGLFKCGGDFIFYIFN